MPGMIHDDPVQRRNGEDHAERGSWDSTAVGSARFSSGNHLYMAWVATAAAGPSPAPRMIGQIISVVKLTLPSRGNWASAQTSARTASPQRVARRLTMTPTITAVTENSR